MLRFILSMITGFVQSLIKLCGLNWITPDYSTLCRRQKNIGIAISYQKSRNGLYLFFDFTGLKFYVKVNWNVRSINLNTIDNGAQITYWYRYAQTLRIRAFQLTTNNVNDSQVLGDLRYQIPQNEQIDSVYTVGAYDTKHCRQVIVDR